MKLVTLFAAIMVSLVIVMAINSIVNDLKHVDENVRIRHSCAERGGTPVDIRNASGELLAIRCDLRGAP